MALVVPVAAPQATVQPCAGFCVQQPGDQLSSRTQGIAAAFEKIGIRVARHRHFTRILGELAAGVGGDGEEDFIAARDAVIGGEGNRAVSRQGHQQPVSVGTALRHVGGGAVGCGKRELRPRGGRESHEHKAVEMGLMRHPGELLFAGTAQIGGKLHGEI